MSNEQMTDARASYITSIDDISGRHTSFYFDRLSTAESFAAEFSETVNQSSPPTAVPPQGLWCVRVPYAKQTVVGGMDISHIRQAVRAGRIKLDERRAESVKEQQA